MFRFTLQESCRKKASMTSRGEKYEQNETKTSPLVTGEHSRTWFSRTPGRSIARLYAISVASPRATKLQTTGRWRRMSDESFPEQVQRIVVDNAFAFVLGWLLGAGHVLSLFSDLAGAFS